MVTMLMVMMMTIITTITIIIIMDHDANNCDGTIITNDENGNEGDDVDKYYGW